MSSLLSLGGINLHINCFVCRIHRWSAFQHWRPGLPTVCIWSLADLPWWPHGVLQQALPDHRRHQETQGTVRKCTINRQILRQIVISVDCRHRYKLGYFFSIQILFLSELSKMNFPIQKLLAVMQCNQHLQGKFIIWKHFLEWLSYGQCWWNPMANVL